MQSSAVGVCWAGTACAVWQLSVLGPSPAPPLEKDIPANSCAQNSVNKQKHKHKRKNPKIPKFPISKIHDLPLLHLGRHCWEHVPLSLVFKLCGLSTDRQRQ